MAGTGLPYFPLNCQLDEKFELIEAEFGNDGLSAFAVIIKLLQRIYGEHGYYCEWSDEVEILFSRKIGLSDNRDFVNNIIKKALNRGIFSQQLFNDFGILTSPGIQKRYFEAVKRRKKVEVKKEYLMLDVRKIPNNVDISTENVDISTENVDIFEQRREEERKEEKRRGEDTTSHSPAAPLLSYGEFENVLLTEKQYEKIKEIYQNHKKLIDKISAYLVNSSKSYKNHYALIKKIANEDNWAKERPKPKAEEVEVKKHAPMPEELKAKMERLFKGDN